jgi:integrase
VLQVELHLKPLPDYRQMVAIFLLGVHSGLRIQEMLDLDLDQGTGTMIQTHKSKGNKKHIARDIPLHTAAQYAIKRYLEEEQWTMERPDKLFTLSYRQVLYRLQDAFRAAGMEGKLATHSMRKTFAQRMYKRLGKDIVATQRAMGHASVNNTATYISVDADRITKAILED